MKYIPQDFHDAFGITIEDLLCECGYLTWAQVCHKAADAANGKLSKENKNIVENTNNHHIFITTHFKADPNGAPAKDKVDYCIGPREKIDLRIVGLEPVDTKTDNPASDMLALLVRVQKLESEVERLKNETV